MFRRPRQRCLLAVGRTVLAPVPSNEIRVPVVEEQLSVELRQVETDRVRVRTAIDVHEAIVEETLRVGSLKVNRVVVDCEVAAAPEPRREGDTLIIPIVEERLVIEKRLFVIEEVHVTGLFRDETVNTPVSLRRMRAVIERDGNEQSSTGETDGRPT